jgi:hypothetical protein
VQVSNIMLSWAAYKTMNQELLRHYNEQVAKNQREKNTPSKWANARIIMREPVYLGKYKIENPLRSTSGFVLMGALN